MNINSLGAIKSYNKIDAIKSTSSSTKRVDSSIKNSNKDTISFSGVAKETSDYNLKLEAIKKQLSDGSYKLDADAIASKLMGNLYL